MDPSTADLMGYCGPPWISDYHFRTIQERIAALRSACFISLDRATEPDPTEPYLAIAVDPDGSLHRSSVHPRRTRPRGDSVAVTYLDAEGRSETVEAVLRRVSDLEGGVLFVPVSSLDATRVRVDGFG